MLPDGSYVVWSLAERQYGQLSFSVKVGLEWLERCGTNSVETSLVKLLQDTMVFYSVVILLWNARRCRMWTREVDLRVCIGECRK